MNQLFSYLVLIILSNYVLPTSLGQVFILCPFLLYRSLLHRHTSTACSSLLYRPLLVFFMHKSCTGLMLMNAWIKSIHFGRIFLLCSAASDLKLSCHLPSKSVILLSKRIMSAKDKTSLHYTLRESLAVRLHVWKITLCGVDLERMDISSYVAQSIFLSIQREMLTPDIECVLWPNTTQKNARIWVTHYRMALKQRSPSVLRSHYTVPEVPP